MKISRRIYIAIGAGALIGGCASERPKFAVVDDAPMPRRTPATAPARLPSVPSPSPSPSIDDAIRAVRLREDIPTAKRIVESGLDINARDQSGRTLLSHAASEGEGAFCQWLIDRGADVNAKQQDSSSPKSD